MLCLRPAHVSYDDGRCWFDGTAMTRFRDAAAAIEAERALGGGCGPRCEGRHMIVYSDGTRLHVLSGTHEPPAPDLAEQLSALYARDRTGLPPECWPAPPELNEPLTPSPVPSALPGQLARGQQLWLRQQLSYVR